MDICWLCVGLAGTAVYLLVQFIRFIFADADLTLLWAARFGKTPGKTADLVRNVWYERTTVYKNVLLYKSINLWAIYATKSSADALLQDVEFALSS